MHYKTVVSNDKIGDSSFCKLQGAHRLARLTKGMSIQELAGMEPAYVCFGCGVFATTLRVMVAHLMYCQEHQISQHPPVFRFIREVARRHRFLRDMTREVYVCRHCKTYRTLESTAYKRHQESCAVKTGSIREKETTQLARKRGCRAGRGRRQKNLTSTDTVTELRILCSKTVTQGEVTDVTREPEVVKEPIVVALETLPTEFEVKTKGTQTPARLPVFRNYNPLFKRYYSDNSEDDD